MIQLNFDDNQPNSWFWFIKALNNPFADPKSFVQLTIFNSLTSEEQNPYTTGTINGLMKLLNEDDIALSDRNAIFIGSLYSFNHPQVPQTDFVLSFKEKMIEGYFKLDHSLDSDLYSFGVTSEEILEELLKFVHGLPNDRKSHLHGQFRNHFSKDLKSWRSGINEQDLEQIIEIERGRKPIHVAVEEGNLDIIRKLLLSGCNLDDEDNTGFNPLRIASYTGNIEAMKKLVEHGADINYQDSREQKTALHEAAYYGHAEYIAEVCKFGANPNLKASCGRTPLRYDMDYAAGRSGDVLRNAGGVE